MAMVEADDATSEDKPNAEQVLGLLKSIMAPGGQRNIVAAGFVKEIEVTDGDVRIVFSPDTRSQDKVELMETAIRDLLGVDGVFGEVDIQRTRPFSEDEDTLSRGHASERPDLAPDAGYGSAGPEPLSGPGERSGVNPAYEGKLPVLQWEISPDDADAASGNADLNIDGWDFRMWWQEHDARLVYTSIQAMQDDGVDHEGAARSHPVGRMEAVNLVYDLDRGAVVAIYGTVRDFRPFVEAFYRSYVLRN